MPSPSDILDAAEEAIRRHGPGKARVVDVARALGISHGTIYRHFASKDELRDAVARRWLRRTEETLAEIIRSEEGPREERLYRWLRRLMETRRERCKEDPELFALYGLLAEKTRGVTEEHADRLVEQLAAIIRPSAQSETPSLWDRSPPEVARAIFHATARFHHPEHAPEWDDPEIDAAFESVWQLVRSGLAGPDGLLEKS